MSEEFHEGDLIEAVNGETVIRGRVKYSDSVDALYWSAGGSPIVLDYLTTNHGFTLTVIEKAAPKLPSEPGSVIAWITRFYTGLAVLEKTDQWCYNGVTLNSAALWQEIDGHAIVPLESVPVTAKRVLDAIRQRIGSIDSAHDFQAVAATFGVTK